MADLDTYFGADTPPVFEHMMPGGAIVDPPPAKQEAPADPMATIAKEMTAGRERQDALERERRETVGPLQGEMLRSLQQPVAKMGPLQKVPPAPKQNIQQDLNDFVGTALIMGALGGAFTRRHATAALNTFAGAMEGRKQGLTDDFKARIEQWQKQVEEIKTNNAEEIQRYRAVFENQQANIEQKRAALQLVASEYQNRAMYESARQTDLVHSAQVYQQLVAQQARMTDAKGRLDETIRHHLEQEKQKASAMELPEHLKPVATNIAELYLSYLGPDALKNVGKGGQSGAILIAAHMEIARLMKERGLTPEKLAVIWAEGKGLNRAEQATAQRFAQFDLAATEANQAIRYAETIIDEVWRSGNIPANKAIRAWETQTGSVEERRLGQVLQAVVNTYARAISTSGGTVSDKTHAYENLPMTDTKDQMKASLGVMKREIEFALQSPDMVMGHLRGMYSHEGQRPAAPPADDGEWKDLGNGIKVKVR